MKLENVNDFIARNAIVDSETPYRQKYHIMAPIGLINDPNGFCSFQGKYYLFYQTHPFKPYHGDKYWAQLVSDDLVNWEYRGIALEPEYWFEKDGCFSGNILVENDKMYLFYTGNIWKDGVEFEVGEEYQCLAISDDGIDFKKLSEPIIGLPDFSLYTPHYRDPKVWKKDDQYYLIVGAQLKEKKPCIDFYYSSDLINWERKGILLEAQEGEHSRAYMWECPGYSYIDNKDVLFICPQGMAEVGDLTKNRHQSGYLIGTIDYEKGSFQALHHFQLMDYGFEFYAPQVFTDQHGRHLCIGWMGLPDADDHPTVEHNWLHCLTLPTELIMKDNRLYRKPVAELKQLRQREIRVSDNSFSAECYEMIVEFPVGHDLDIYIRASRDMSFYTKLSYNSNENTITLDRNQSQANLQGSRTVILQEAGKNISLQLFVDRSSVEVFINGGEYVLTSRIFPADEDLLNKITFKGNLLPSIKVWELG